MDACPVSVSGPVRHDPDAMRLIVPGREPIAIRNAAGPVAQFQPGWQAIGLFTLLDPLWLLVLRHDTGTIAWWHLDSDGAMTAMIEHRPEAERLMFRHRLEPLALWLGMAAGAPVRIAVPPAMRAELHAFLQLPHQVRSMLAALLDDAHAALLNGTDGVATPSDPWLSEPTPPLHFEPIGGGRRLHLGNPGRLVPLMTGATVAELGEGWRFESLDAALAPILSIVLRHADGTEALWFADLHGQRVAHHASALAPPLQHHIVRQAGPLFQDRWRRWVLDDAASERDPPSPIGVLSSRHFETLARRHLDRCGEGNTHVWILQEPPPPGLAYAIPTGTGLRAFEVPALERCLAPRLQREIRRLLLDGHMLWPSPFDGTMLRSDGFALMTDLLSSLYRFRDDRIGLVFYVVCHGGYNDNTGLYFPTADVLVTSTRRIAQGCRPFWGARELLLRHVIRFGDDLSQGALLPRDPVVRKYFGSCALHIGHYIWQDVCGLAYLLQSIPDTGRLPPLNLFDDPVQTEFLGPVERIFPVFEGRVTHHRGAFNDGLGVFYRRNQRVVRYTATTVPTSMGPAVIAAAAAEPGLRAVRDAADAARRNPAPVILLGIRAGNRTLADQAEFAAALLADLGRRHPGCTVVLDGLNDTADRGRAMVAADGSQLAEEFAVATRLAALADRLDVRFVDNINRSALASVLWCSRADVFVAPLGAALAKYRWVCNTPGLILSSRWNLLHRPDLRIYDAPEWMEDPSEILFNPLDAVEDVGTQINTLAHDGRNNFLVDHAGVFGMLAGLIDRHLPKRLLTRHAPTARPRLIRRARALHPSATP